MKHIFQLAAVFALLLTLASTALAQGTAFTYQGRLSSSGNPATGTYDLTFALFSVSSGAGQIGNTVTNPAIVVNNGLFTVTLDFDTQFPGADRWLEIGVRTNGGGTFSMLTPRQVLTPTPYAIFANTASNLSGSLPAANISGTIPLALLPAGLLTNGASGVSLSGTLAGSLNGNASTAATAGSFTGLLMGDVTGTQNGTAVSTVGGQSAASIASGVVAANNATPANLPSTIVERDASGNFSAGALAAASVSGDGSGLTNLNGTNLVAGSVGTNQLVTGAALASLQASGQSAIPSGGIVMSTNVDDTNLINAGYPIKLGGVQMGEGWQRQASTGAPSARGFGPCSAPEAVWTGSEMLIWGGVNGAGDLADGARYNPGSRVWTPIPTNNAPSARHLHTEIWTGSELIVWGGQSNTTYLATGARYSPASNTWSAVTDSGAPSVREYQIAVWTGTEMIIWSGYNGTTFLNTGARYNPALNTWTNMSTVGAPSGRLCGCAVWSGTELLVWGGTAGVTGTGPWPANGGRYNPLTDTWTNMATAPLTPVSMGREGAVYVWTGTEMIVWSGYGNTAYQSDGARYNPASDTWMLISTTGIPAVRSPGKAVWTGNEMIVWGGRRWNGSYVYLNDGARYDPVANVWNTPAVANAPAPRMNPAMVWTGTEMLVFGGLDGTPTYFNDTFSYTLPRTVYLYMKP